MQLPSVRVCTSEGARPRAGLGHAEFGASTAQSPATPEERALAAPRSPGTAEAGRGVEPGPAELTRRPSVTPRSVFDFVDLQTVLTGEQPGVAMPGGEGTSGGVAPQPTRRRVRRHAVLGELCIPVAAVCSHAQIPPTPPSSRCAGKRGLDADADACKRARLDSDEGEIWIKSHDGAMLDLGD